MQFLRAGRAPRSATTNKKPLQILRSKGRICRQWNKGRRPPRRATVSPRRGHITTISEVGGLKPAAMRCDSLIPRVRSAAKPPDLWHYLTTLHSMPKTILRNSDLARPRTGQHPLASGHQGWKSETRVSTTLKNSKPKRVIQPTVSITPIAPIRQTFPRKNIETLRGS